MAEAKFKQSLVATQVYIPADKLFAVAVDPAIGDQEYEKLKPPLAEIVADPLLSPLHVTLFCKEDTDTVEHDINSLVTLPIPTPS